MTRKLRKPYIKGGSIWALILGGIIFLSIIFCICVGRDRARLYKADDESIEFIRNRLTNYDRYVTDDRVKSLIRLLDKTNELSDRLAGMDDIDEAFLAQYIYDQRLSGIFVLDDKFELIGNLARGYSSYDMWQEIINSDNVQNIIDYPQKSYMARIELKNGGYIDLASYGRMDAKGTVIGYQYVKTEYAKNNNLTIQNVLAGYKQKNDGTIVITKGDDIIASNNKKLILSMLRFPPHGGQVKCRCIDFFVLERIHLQCTCSRILLNWMNKNKLIQKNYIRFTFFLMF